MAEVSLPPSTPTSSALSAAQLKVISAHTGADQSEIAAKFEVLRLGELAFAVGSDGANNNKEATPEAPAEPRTRPSNAALLLAEYLREHGRAIFGSRVALELRSGVGVVGVSAAEAAPGLRVTLTEERDAAVSLLHANAALNAGWISAGDVHVRSLPALADAAELASAEAATGPFDAVLGADVFATAADAAAAAAAVTRLLLRRGGASPDAGAAAGAAGSRRAARKSFDDTRAPLVLLAHEVRHSAKGEDGPLAAFLTELTGGARPPFELIALELTKASREAYSVTPSPRLGPMAGASPPLAPLAEEDGAAAGAPPPPLAIARPHSKPNLVSEAHVRAVQLAAPPPAPAAEGEQPAAPATAFESYAAAAIHTAARQREGAVLLITLTSVA